MQKVKSTHAVAHSRRPRLRLLRHQHQHPKSDLITSHRPVLIAAMGFLVFLGFVTSLNAQVSITSQVPLTAIDICGATSTFLVTINCGAATNNNTLSINQPTGMHYIPGSVTVTATNASITVTENTISPYEDPVFNIGNMAPGNNVTFTYQAKAYCQLIGVNNNNNTLTFNGSAGSPAPHVTNGYNSGPQALEFQGTISGATHPYKGSCKGCPYEGTKPSLP